MSESVIVAALLTFVGAFVISLTVESRRDVYFVIVGMLLLYTGGYMI